MAACASTRLGRCERNVYAHKRESQADNAIFSEQSGDKEPGTADRIHTGSSTVYRYSSGVELMAAFASLANVPIVSGRLTIPSQGLWHADLALATDSPAVPISPSQTLILGTITATCTVVRLTPWTGEVKARVVGGAGGWTTTLPGKQYSMPSGSIPTSMVVGDAARAVGEATPLLDDPAGVASLGPNYFRAYGPAGALLWALTDTGVFPHGWWMDLSGVVHTETIPVSTISSDFSISEVDGACGRYVVFTEFAADWLPGASFSCATGRGTVSRVEHRLENDRMSTEVLSA
jgi:hypothetical protein